MRTCMEYEDWISAWIDGVLEEVARLELTEHMASCPRCQAYFDDQIALHDALEHMDAAAPPGFTAAVMERVRAEAAPERRAPIPFPHWRRWAALAACCALAAIGAWTLDGAGLSQGKAARTAADQPALASTFAADTIQERAPSEELVDAAQDAKAAADSGAEPAPEADEFPPPDSSAAPAGNTADDTLYAGTEENTGGAQADGQLDTADEERAESFSYTTSLAPAQTFLFAITTDSPAAEAWVEEHLSQTWERGGCYELTEEQYTQLRTLLTEQGAAYTECPGGNSGPYLLYAS